MRRVLPKAPTEFDRTPLLAYGAAGRGILLCDQRNARTDVLGHRRAVGVLDVAAAAAPAFDCGFAPCIVFGLTSPKPRNMGEEALQAEMAWVALDKALVRPLTSVPCSADG
jgi:hypothetical protein